MRRFETLWTPSKVHGNYGHSLEEGTWDDGSKWASGSIRTRHGIVKIQGFTRPQAKTKAERSRVYCEIVIDGYVHYGQLSAPWTRRSLITYGKRFAEQIVAEAKS